MTVNHLITGVLVACLLGVLGAGCASRQSARERAVWLEEARRRCGSVWAPIAPSDYLGPLVSAVGSGDLDAVEQAGRELVERARNDAIGAFHAGGDTAGQSDDAELPRLREALDALVVGPGAPLRVGADQFFVAPAVAAVLIVASLERGDVAAARAWALEAGAPADTPESLAACWGSLEALQP